jgi:antitoxin component of MazEF toxin-antitoxin module
MAKQKIIKTGHSLAVTIPSHFVQSLGIKAGHDVEVKVEPEGGQIIYTFSGTKQLPLSQNFIQKRKSKK